MEMKVKEEDDTQQFNDEFEKKITVSDTKGKKLKLLRREGRGQFVKSLLKLGKNQHQKDKAD